MPKDSNQNPFLEKPLPSNTDAEQALLGMVLIDNDVMPQLAEAVLPEDLYSPMHRSVYAAMLELFGSKRPIDPILIGEILTKQGILEQTGGVPAITNLSYGLPHISDLEEYIKVVLDHATARELIRACNRITAATLEGADPLDEIKSDAERTIFEICEGRNRATKPQVVGELAFHSLEHKRQLAEQGVQLVGIPSGLIDLDNMTGGWRSPDLMILAGRPGMGKTALGMQFAMRAATDGRVVAFFSLEMSKDQLVSRVLCTEARVNLFRYNNAYIHDQEWDRLKEAYEFEIRHKGLFIDDEPAISPMKMLAKARRIAAEQKRLDLIVVDYLQLMSASGKSESRLQEVSAISRELKAIAKQMDVPVLALSQLSRAPEARNPPKPVMSDLRESGSIEQDADMVMFVYREAYYKKLDDGSNSHIAEIILAKQRNGPTGDVQCHWNAPSTRFENLQQERRD